MEKMMRFIDIFIPVTACNLNCHYCYISSSNRRGVAAPSMEYSSEYIGRALSKERLGGTALFNMCAWGETMIWPMLTEVTKELLKEGHYVWIVTNGLITKRFDEMLEQYTNDELSRLGFKLSFHYLEFMRLNKMEEFFSNVDKVKKAGCSFTLELTSCDELEPYIDSIKQIIHERYGADCHVTIPRDGSKKELPLLSKHSLEEYNEIWKVFDSDMFDFKMSVWGQKRKEYCYAGCYTGLLNIATGEYKACYSTALRQNIFKDIKKPIHFIPMGHHCQQSHCYNSHAFLALGCIPEIGEDYSYERMRNRKCDDGTEWLNENMKNFISQKLCDNHKIKGGGWKKISNELAYHAITKSRKLIRKLRGLE